MPSEDDIIKCETKADKKLHKILRQALLKPQERIKQLEAQLVGCENSLNKTNNAFKELESALHKIDNWAKAYPIKAFPEPDLKKAAKVLKAAGLTLDAISASNMRHVINRVKEIVEVVLKGGE